MTLQPYVDTWRHHDVRYDRVPDVVDRAIEKSPFELSPLERRAVEWIVETVGDLVAGTDTAEQFGEALASELIETGPMLPRVLGAYYLEYAYQGDGHPGEEHVRVDGELGTAVSGVIDRLLPRVRRRHPRWFESVFGPDSEGAGEKDVD